MTVPTDFDKPQILAALVPILEHITSDCDVDVDHPIGAETRLVTDLGWESFDIVEFVVHARKHFQRSDLPLGELFVVDGYYVGDLSVGQVVDFLYEVLRRPAGGAVTAPSHQAPVKSS